MARRTVTTVSALSRTIIYGQYRREQLFEAARRSRCCLYLSDDDRGPLRSPNLAGGRPTIGLPHGAPFVTPGVSGLLLPEFSLSSCRDAVLRCHCLDRRLVAAIAAEQFDTERIVERIFARYGTVQLTHG